MCLVKKSFKIRYQSCLPIIQRSFCFSCSGSQNGYRYLEFDKAVIIVQYKKFFLTTITIPTMIEAHVQVSTDICQFQKFSYTALMDTCSRLCDLSPATPSEMTPATQLLRVLHATGLSHQYPSWMALVSRAALPKGTFL